MSSSASWCCVVVLQRDKRAKPYLDGQSVLELSGVGLCSEERVPLNQIQLPLMIMINGNCTFSCDFNHPINPRLKIQKQNINPVWQLVCIDFFCLFCFASFCKFLWTSGFLRPHVSCFVLFFSRAVRLTSIFLLLQQATGPSLRTAGRRLCSSRWPSPGSSPPPSRPRSSTGNSGGRKVSEKVKARPALPSGLPRTARRTEGEWLPVVWGRSKEQLEPFPACCKTWDFLLQRTLDRDKDISWLWRRSSSQP